MTTKIEIVTVGALKQFLKVVPDDYEVILSKDGEGNIFSPLVYLQRAGVFFSWAFCNACRNASLPRRQ